MAQAPPLRHLATSSPPTTWTPTFGKHSMNFQMMPWCPKTLPPLLSVGPSSHSGTIATCGVAYPITSLGVLSATVFATFANGNEHVELSLENSWRVSVMICQIEKISQVELLHRIKNLVTQIERCERHKLSNRPATKELISALSAQLKPYLHEFFNRLGRQV